MITDLSIVAMLPGGGQPEFCVSVRSNTFRDAPLPPPDKDPLFLTRVLSSLSMHISQRLTPAAENKRTKSF